MAAEAQAMGALVGGHQAEPRGVTACHAHLTCRRSNSCVLPDVLCCSGAGSAGMVLRGEWRGRAGAVLPAGGCWLHSSGLPPLEAHAFLACLLQVLSRLSLTLLLRAVAPVSAARDGTDVLFALPLTDPLVRRRCSRWPRAQRQTTTPTASSRFARCCSWTGGWVGQGSVKRRAIGPTIHRSIPCICRTTPATMQAGGGRDAADEPGFPRRGQR